MNCIFSFEYSETTVHLLWYCNVVKTFWLNICDIISGTMDERFVLFWRNVLFGLLEINMKKPHTSYMINLIIIMAKLLIHKCKFTCSKPCFILSTMSSSNTFSWKSKMPLKL